MLDFSQEEKQKDIYYGPIPSGSCVVVTSQVLLPRPESTAVDNPLVCIGQSGLYYLYCEFTVVKGQYQNSHWRQCITLPASMQKITLSANQQTAARIGGATIKAMLESAGRQPVIQSFEQLNGLRFPVKVKINQKPVENNGRIYWNNEIAKVITPDMPEYLKIKQDGEIINPNGAIEGKAAQESSQSDPFGSPSMVNPHAPTPSEFVDEVPF